LLTSGTRIGPYEIQSSIGAGGMGEVYRACDTRLGREVAIKILPGSFAQDDDRLRRFEQEERAVAALSHPGILAVFDVGRHEGSPYLVSELLEGESLRSLLDRGPLPQRKAIDYGGQIAQGLASAHEKSVVHRDVKPENIFITREGRAKILDFGLAKLSQNAADAKADSDGVTMTSSHTAAGVVMGTAGYMAPEQVRGDMADARTDIFALGAVLYEMLSGHRAFRRESPAETMTAILRDDPPEIQSSERLVSPALDRIVRRCLEKDPEQRFQSARDLSFALSALSGTNSTGANRIAEVERKYPKRLILAVALAIVVGALATWLIVRRPAAQDAMQFAIPVRGEVSYMALSPDGTMLAFVSPDETSGTPMLYLQSVGSPEIRQLAGTEGATYPFWSPDSAYIAFFAKGGLRKMAVAGGPPQAIAKVAAARGGSWSRNNVILYEPDTGTPLWRVNADGSDPEPVTDKIFAPEEQSHRWPLFLPGGKRFLFWAGDFGGSKDDRVSGIYESSLDKKEKKLVVLAHSSFAMDSKYLFYADFDGHLLAVPFDRDKGAITGTPAVLANFVSVQAATYWTSLTVSENGTLIYNANPGAALSALTWFDRSGKQLGQIGQPAVQYNPTLSPDGSRVAVDISDQKANNVDVWLESTQGGGNSRFTFSPAEEVVGVWSRDGTNVAYRSAGGGNQGGLQVKPANGLEANRQLFKLDPSDDIFPNSWSPDDQHILCTLEGDSGYHLELVSAVGETSAAFENGPGNQVNGMISPDGKWVAYASDESGIWEIYVTTFPAGTGKWQVSRGGGTEPRWRGDGKEIFYISPAGVITSVPVSTVGTFSTGNPTPLFQFYRRAAISSTDIISYDVTKDGKRFLVNRYIKPEKVPPLTIILNADSRAKSQ
jgi:eukaryotic-like serine/threonine-protein kinase